MIPIGHDIVTVPQSFVNETGLQLMDRDELLRKSDFISLSCNLTTENRHMLDTRAFGLMKPGVFIINTARGALIDEAALVTALQQGKVAGEYCCGCWDSGVCGAPGATSW